VSLQACKSAEPIPGYRVQERIGAGGYGEVWRVEAPGGLTKAIKFVYGYLNDERASNELKALNRIREVRHPFLLSLERIEVVDGQLLIVTELADESLKDRFEACRTDGMTGIPRDELLQLLADAADALDFMRERHSLQHLDIKPENLLIMGGHIKVADFGLVKDVYATGASLMGGMTPVYASPEVFDGRPSRQSDQYGLAIVYQEMLTSALPFSGRTAAQLAKQHTSTPPRLTSLPDADQAIIAKALEKSPDDRFEGCRQLIESLRQGRPPQCHAGPETATPADADAMADTASLASYATEPVSTQRGTSPPASSEHEASAVNTVALAAADPSAKRSGPRRKSAPIVRRSTVRPAVRDLPPIEIAAGAAAIPPTLVLGIGGTAARILSHLRRRWHDRLGDLTAVPALQLLLLDTDSTALVAASRGEHAASLANSETLALPLRRPQEYRTDSSTLLTWLSRRWLYNIPRSLQTEGLRPLGRLAFVDHAAQVASRIRAALSTATDAAAIASSAEATGGAFVEAPLRVLIVASTAGGTGSGMVLDLAYAARQALAELGLEENTICGFLAHATRHQTAPDLAITNTYACLSELYTYSHRDGFYPGDPAAQLDPVDGTTPTFDHTYIVHLGDNLTDPQFDAAADSLAEYLYLDTVTAGRKFFDRCRHGVDPNAAAAGSAAASDVTVGTLGVCRIGFGNGPLIDETTGLLCRHVIDRWRGTEQPAADQEEAATEGKALLAGPPQSTGPTAAEQEMDQRASAQADQLALSYDAIGKQLHQVVQEQLDGSPDNYFRTVLQQLVDEDASAADSDTPLAIRVVQRIDAIVGGSAGGSGDGRPSTSSPAVSLDGLVSHAIDRRTTELRTTVYQWILELTDTVEIRAVGAERAAGWFSRRIQTIEQQAHEQLVQLESQTARRASEIAKLAASKRAGGRRAIRFSRWGKPKTPLTRILLEYANLKLQKIIVRGISRLAQSLQGPLGRCAKEIAGMQRELARLGDAFEMLGSHTALEEGIRDGSPLKTLPPDVAEAVRDRIPALAAELDGQFQETFIGPRGGFVGVLSGNVDHRARLPAALRAAARSVVRLALRQIDVDQLSEETDQVAQRIRGCLQTVTPPWLKCGGDRRLLVTLPEGSSAPGLTRQIERQIGTQPSLACDAEVDVALCCEVQQLPLAGAAAALIENHPELADVAGRVHTRLDVEWAKLDATAES
jgi:hypothetical protein